MDNLNYRISMGHVVLHDLNSQKISAQLDLSSTKASIVSELLFLIQTS